MDKLPKNLSFAALCPAIPARDLTPRLAAGGGNPPRFTEDGVQIRLMELGERLHVFIEVGEDTTHADLDRAVPLALAWRERLLVTQGPDIKGPAGERNVFYLILDDMAELWGPPAQIARHFNEDTARALHEHVEYVAVERALQEKWGGHPAPVDLLAGARKTLRWLGLSCQEIDTLFREGLARIAAGRPPFEDGYPLSAQQVKDKLKTWRRSKKYRARCQIAQRNQFAWWRLEESMPVTRGQINRLILEGQQIESNGKYWGQKSAGFSSRQEDKGDVQ